MLIGAAGPRLETFPVLKSPSVWLRPLRLLQAPPGSPNPTERRSGRRLSKFPSAEAACWWEAGIPPPNPGKLGGAEIDLIKLVLSFNQALVQEGPLGFQCQEVWVDPDLSQVSICSQTGEKEATLDLMLMIISPPNEQTPQGPSNIKWKSRNVGLNCWSLWAASLSSAA